MKEMPCVSSQVAEIRTRYLGRRRIDMPQPSHGGHLMQDQQTPTTATQSGLAADLTAALVLYGQKSYAALPKVAGVSDLRLRICHSKGGYQEYLVSSPGLAQMRSESNHRALEAKAFERLRCDDMGKMIDLFHQVAPEICTEDAVIALDLYSPSAAGLPRFRLEVDGHEIPTKPGAARSLVKKLIEAGRAQTSS
jgi:hypothetical protein